MFWGAWPLVQRELILLARSTWLYQARVGVMAAMLLMLVWEVGSSLSTFGSGLQAFQKFSVWLMAGTLALAPLLTADCVSRERRQNTLELLFLTALRPGEIMVAKSVAGALRAATLLLACLPVFPIFFLLGGVGWHEVLLLVSFEGAALTVALVAGLWASSYFTGVVSSSLASLAFSALFATGFLACFAPLQDAVGLLLRLGVGMPPSTLGSTTSLVAQILTCLLLAAIPARASLWFLSRRLANSTRVGGRDGRWSALIGWLARPVAPGWLRRMRETSLDRNPIGWLQKRSWTTRVVKWPICAAIILLEVRLVGEASFFWGRDLFWSQQSLVVGLLGFAMSLMACVSFSAEKESGAFELLLVTPRTERDIVHGRLGGLLAEMGPSMGVLLLMAALMQFQLVLLLLPAGLLLWCCAAVGLRNSLRPGLLPLRLLRTVVEVLWLPALLALGMAGWEWRGSEYPSAFLLAGSICWVIHARVASKSSIDTLRDRESLAPPRPA